MGSIPITENALKKKKKNDFFTRSLAHGSNVRMYLVLYSMLTVFVLGGYTAIFLLFTDILGEEREKKMLIDILESEINVLIDI